MTAAQLGLAYAIDLAAGDPEWLPHPVRLFGFIIRRGERRLRRRSHTPTQETAAGALLTAAVVAAGWALGRPRNAVWRILLAWTALATRSLLSEAAAVIDALQKGDLVTARSKLARIVGRDTAHLDETGIARAIIETLAESACDGIVAPLCWLAAGGVSCGLAYKAINTLDSMIGHTEPPYRHFGVVAARLDDGVNFLPARLTSLAIVAAARFAGTKIRKLDSAAAWRVWRRDGDRHASPNAGQSEAAMAGALGVRLGGASSYDGQAHFSSLLNEEGRAPEVSDARAALTLVAIVSGIAFGAAMLFTASRRGR